MYAAGIPSALKEPLVTQPELDEDRAAIRRSNRRQLIGILVVVLIFGGGAVVELIQRLLSR